MSLKRSPIHVAAALMICIITASPTVFAQSAEGAPDPAIDIAPERVTAEVAPVTVAVGGLPPLPELEFEAPEPESVRLATPTTDEFAPPDIPPDTIEAGTVVETGEQVFFNATLGGGSVNSVLGTINVFRLGEGPQFRLGYDHRGSDGFNFNEPGTGYFVQENEIETWVRVGEDGNALLEIEGAYADRRFGLQRRPLYYSADSRAVNAHILGTYEWSTRSSASFSIDFAEDRRVLAAASPETDSPSETHRLILPTLRGRLEWPRLRLGVSAEYEGRFDQGSPRLPSSNVLGSLSVEGVPLTGLTVSLVGTTRYRFDDGAYFPVEAGIRYNAPERWSVDLSGGLRVRDRSFSTLWDDYPAAIAQDAQFEDGIPLAETLFTRGELELGIVPGLVDLSGAGEWRETADALVVGAYDESIGGYPILAEDRRYVATEIAATVTLGDRAQFSAGWNADWEDRRLGEPQHQVEMLVEYDMEPLVARLGSVVPIDDEAAIPELESELRYRLAANIELRLFGRDLLGPLDDAGRTARGLEPREADPFITPGFELGAAIRVSF